MKRGKSLRYFLDTEFNGFGGSLISLGLVHEDGPSLYLVYGVPNLIDTFVRDRVQPNLLSVPPSVVVRHVSQKDGAYAIEVFLHGDDDPQIIADWPEDLRLFCQALMLEPDVMVPITRLRFEMHRVTSYPTDLAGAVEHNAWWDAMALKQRLMRAIPNRNCSCPDRDATTAPMHMRLKESVK